MKRNTIVIAVTSASLALVAALVALRGSDTPQRPVAASPVAAALNPIPAPALDGPGCRYAAGERLAWRLEAETTITAGDNPPLIDRFAGTLAVRVESSTGRTSKVAAHMRVERLDAPTMPPAARAGLEAPFRLTIDGTCRVYAVETDPTVAPEAAAYLRTLVLETQFIVPVGAGKVWSLDQTDGTGTVAVAYTRTDNDVERRKRAYRGDGASDLGFVASRGAATFAADGRGLIRFSSEDTVDSTGFRIRTVVRGQAAEAVDVPAPAAGLREAELPTREGEIMPYQLSDEERALTPEGAVARYAERAAADENAGVFEPRRYLVAAVRNDPAVAEATADALIAGRYDDRTSSMAMLALSQADTPPAVAALARIGESASAPVMRRMHAAAHLGTIPTATPAVFSALTSLSRDPAGTEADRAAVSGTARLALGAVMFTSARQTGDAALTAARDAARENLRGLLNDGDHSVRVSAVAAAGNSGDAELVQALMPLLGDADRNLRAEAIHAVRRRPPAEVEAVVRTRAAVETDAYVLESMRSAVQQAMMESPGKTLEPATIDVLTARLAQEPAADTRMVLVDTLGAGLTRRNRSAAVEKALADHYVRERDPRVRVRIGRYLPFNKLPAAVR